jgi:hypothetical protein
VVQFVRAGLRHHKWLETAGIDPPNFPADVITDLQTKGDELSVFEVSPTVTPERIAIAIAAGKMNPQETSYAVFERDAVIGLGINPKKRPGGTCDSEVNTCHYDLVIGTASKLLDLAGVMATAEVLPILKKKVEELLKAGSESGQLTLSQGMKEKLQGNG